MQQFKVSSLLLLWLNENEHLCCSLYVLYVYILYYPCGDIFYIFYICLQIINYIIKNNDNLPQILSLERNFKG